MSTIIKRTFVISRFFHGAGKPKQTSFGALLRTCMYYDGKYLNKVATDSLRISKQKYKTFLQSKMIRQVTTATKIFLPSL